MTTMMDARAANTHEDRTELTSDVGLADPEEDQQSLPPFIQRGAGGIHVVLPELESRALFHQFVAETFESGLRFVDLDYACLHHLLYVGGREEPARLAQRLQQSGKPPTLRLASDIVPFAHDRRRFYRSVRMVDGGRAAEYTFEPAKVDRVIEEPVYGERGADGIAPVIDHFRKTAVERVTLDFDEFVAAMWNIHVRFGIDAGLVRAALASGRSETLVIAHRLSPVEGQDAKVEELTSLHRDDKPKLLPDGRIDLHQFENRFPQVERNARLIRKIPCVPGKRGWDISGSELLPRTPTDIDISRRVGTGTRLECTEEGEFIVTEAGGFLHINPANNAFSITDKIINHQGVSLRTTGNLILSGDEYEEHGEVQELARVEGKNMTFMADVFGIIVSHGGRVAFRKNLSAGSATSPGGTISVDGSASRATIEAIDGEITLGYAESCLIIGKRVRIRQAVLCDIVADELMIETAEGCALAGRRVQVGTASAWHDTETTISMQVPDLCAFSDQLDELKNNLVQHQQAAAAKAAEVERIASQQEVKNYSILAAKLRAGELNMSQQQEANWQKLLSRVTPLLHQLKMRNDELNALRGASQALAGRIESITRRSREMSSNIACSVGTMRGETAIRTLKSHLDAPSLQTLAHKELRACLRESRAECTILFNGSAGNFEWTFSGKGGAPSAG
ncbi:MAG TPA: flagellar assembly protein A [Noviherbaspirillum sp.]